MRLFCATFHSMRIISGKLDVLKIVASVVRGACAKWVHIWPG